MVQIIKHETYVEATQAGIRFVVDANTKFGKYTVTMQRKPTTEMHDGEEFVNFNLSWLYVDEAAARYGSFITKMAEMASKLKQGLCGSCGKTFAKNQLAFFEGGPTCSKCMERKINWEINFNDSATVNRKNGGMQAMTFKYPSNDWKYHNGISA